ncbi:MAG TPA: hypothetical protein VFA54_10915 [Bryobacterales bacterium]|jgi:hypothetical protein|nr:hypothetical protein [Bryobacterales bacterium]
MRYEVVFHTTYTEDGRRLGDPTELLRLPAGVIRERSAVRVDPPLELEYPEQTEGEDLLDFAGTETWEYEVADGREQEFIEAAKNCPEVIEFSEIPQAA